MTRVAERLPLQATSVPRARCLMDGFRPALAAEAFEQLRLVVSELVANCVRHSRGQGTISLEAVSRDRYIHVAVKCPKGESAPHIPASGSRRGGGLGLFIVDTVAADWGIGEEESDSLVWADIAVEEPGYRFGP
jgi:anti-sigma regulatory factor (Ser/Thr protein kinase)